jgi:hypothetical protein
MRIPKRDGSVDGLLLLGKPLFRSSYFWLATAVGAACLIGDAYIIFEHWQLLSEKGVLWFSIPLILQVIFLWWRVLRYYDRLKDLCPDEVLADSSMETRRQTILATAAGGLTDILFWAFALHFLMIICVCSALSH